MRKIASLLLALVVANIVAAAHEYEEPYRYYEPHHRDAPIWHSSGFFNKRDLMNSMLYGAFGVKFDWIELDGVRVTTYGGYVEYCNIMLNFTYGRKDIYEAYGCSASFLIPIHPNFRFGPRIEDVSLSDKFSPYKSSFSHSKINIGLTLDVHFKYVSITGNISQNAWGIGIGWAFGRI